MTTHTERYMVYLVMALVIIVAFVLVGRTVLDIRGMNEHDRAVCQYTYGYNSDLCK